VSRRRNEAALLASALLAACACSCEKKPAPPATAVADASATAPAAIRTPGEASPGDASPGAVGAASSPSSTDAGDAVADVAPRWAFDCNDDGVPKSGKSIGHTSVVFKVELSNGKKAAWKPNARKVKGRYKGEVAAYRLAKALGIVNVPPACFRAFDAGALAAALAGNADAAKVFANEVLVEGGKVHGVVIPWIDGLSFWPLEKEPLRSEARSWLAAGSNVPEAKRDLARQTSTLVAFDFITDNWDRYSGANVGLDKAGALVLYVDNDAAFMEAPPRELVARNKALVEATDRYSRRFVARLRELDEPRLAAAFGEETAGKPLLSKAVVSTVLGRVKELLDVIDAKIAKQGEAETLFFP